jgi:hypothetical protein
LTLIAFFGAILEHSDEPVESNRLGAALVSYGLDSERHPRRPVGQPFCA